jgi:uncharacterized membrane protein
LQVIWAIGISMVVLSALVFLPLRAILTIGLLLILGHNLLDPITRNGSSPQDALWYVRHQPHSIFINSTHLVNIVYPVLPWIGVIALGYVFGSFYQADFAEATRRRWLLAIGASATLLFLVLRTFNLYGEPHPWHVQDTSKFSVISFLNLTKYPPSLQFLLMTLGPALICLAVLEPVRSRFAKPVVVFGNVPLFFYILHLYLIHALALLLLLYEGRDWHQYILSFRAIMSGALKNAGFGLGAVYIIWVLVILLLYPLCKGYQKYREKNPTQWWLRYL